MSQVIILRSWMDGAEVWIVGRRPKKYHAKFGAKKTIKCYR